MVARNGNSWANVSTIHTGSFGNSMIATIENAGNGWYKVERDSIGSEWNNYYTSSFNRLQSNSCSGSNGMEMVFMFGVFIYAKRQASDPTSATVATAQTSPVLLPQGITTGRDITGVNLFENVRKQGALNLDGNSWAEVHDNES